MSINDIDSASLELIIQLQLADLESLTGNDGNEGETPHDGDLAVDSYRAELDSLANFVSDREIARGISLAEEMNEQTATPPNSETRVSIQAATRLPAAQDTEADRDFMARILRGIRAGAPVCREGAGQERNTVPANRAATPLQAAANTTGASILQRGANRGQDAVGPSQATTAPAQATPHRVATEVSRQNGVTAPATEQPRRERPVATGPPRVGIPQAPAAHGVGAGIEDEAPTTAPHTIDAVAEDIGARDQGLAHAHAPPMDNAHGSGDDSDEDDEDGEEDGNGVEGVEGQNGVNSNECFEDEPNSDNDDDESEEEECTACQNPARHDHLTRATCDHPYCGSCIAQLVLASLTDESLFPPRCCRKLIHTEIIEALLSPDQVIQYHEKEVEYNTVNRTYCHVATCSAFICPSRIVMGVATCGKCSRRTCEACKGASHGSKDCPKDEGTQEVLRLAEKQGWKRCFKCRRLIELRTGCNHMTCKCGGQFCYECSLPWKKCTCPQWVEHRLLERANEVVDGAERRAAAAGAVVDPAGRAERLALERRNIIRHQGCRHSTWRREESRTLEGLLCQVCHDRLPDFIYRCGVCNFSACARCRHNRL